MIDRHADWLEWAEETLTLAGYEVVPVTDLDEAAECCQEESFHLTLIQLDKVEENIVTFSKMAKSSDTPQRFVVMFPPHQTHGKMRIVFRAGAYDTVDKPYQREELLQMVAKEISDAEQTSGFPAMIHNASGSGHSNNEKL